MHTPQIADLNGADAFFLLSPPQKRMKRGAEKQLTRDGDDGEVEDSEPQRGLQKADASALASRPIKGLPRRSLATTAGAATLNPAAPAGLTTSEGTSKLSAFAGFSSPTSSPASTTPAETSQPPKFGGFSGFGASSSGNPFSSGSAAAPPTPAAVPSSGSAFPFGNSNSAATASNTDVPAVSDSASSATKTFATFLGSRTRNGSSTTDKPPADSSATRDEDVLFKEEVDYLTHLRGINVSFLSTVQKAIESDPFVDVGSMLDLYQSLRLTEKQKYDEKVEGLKGGPGKEVDMKDATASAPTSSLSMPKPTASFVGFGKPNATSSTSGSRTPSDAVSAPKMAFTFGASSSSGSTAPSTSAPPAPPKSAFSFGTSASTPSLTASSSQPSFTFGSSASTSSSSKASDLSSLGKGRPSSESKPVDALPSGGASSPFSFSSTSTPSLFSKPVDKEKGKDTETASGPSSATSVFGVSASSSGLFGSSTLSTGFATPEKSPNSGFSFGSASPSKGFGGFGKAAAVGSIGNPVGFGFGSPPKTPEEDTPSPAQKPFLFGPPKAKAADAEEAEDGANAEGKAGDEPPVPELITGSVHDKEGEGEEQEETIHEIKSKVYKMVKDDEGKSRWAEQGVGILRLKRHKDTDARRVLLRNSGTGKLVINFRIYSGMNARTEKNVVSFVGHDNGAQATYRIRTKTEEQANDLKSALDREIEFVRAKSPTS